MRIRTLTLLVAIVAGFLGVKGSDTGRQEAFMRQAAYHRRAWAVLKNRAGLPLPAYCGFWPDKKRESYLLSCNPPGVPFFRASVYHRELWLKYHRASANPRACVMPDPPPPPEANPDLGDDPIYRKMTER